MLQPIISNTQARVFLPWLHRVIWHARSFSPSWSPRQQVQRKRKIAAGNEHLQSLSQGAPRQSPKERQGRLPIRSLRAPPERVTGTSAAMD